jgi:hypothetical protein
MKNQNSNSKPTASFSAKQMDNEYKQQLTEKTNYNNSNEITANISSPSMQLNEKVNRSLGCQLCTHF